MGCRDIKEVSYYWNGKTLTAKIIEKKWAIKAMLIPSGKIKADDSY